MNRSEINKAVDHAIGFFNSMKFPLPAWACWTVSEWEMKAPECREIRDMRLGWDVTDFGSGDFPHIGRTIFTLRNGSARIKGYPKTYAEKVMYLMEGQKSPVHYHRRKMEDVINRGGGYILITLWKAAPDDSLSSEAQEVSLDGVRRRISSGETLCLKPGESICIVPHTYHQF